jgi:hypothetical protein
MYDEEEIFGSNDDDILAKPAPSSGHTQSIPLGKGIPGYLASALQRFVDENPDIVNQAYGRDGGRTVPVPVSLYNELSSILTDITDKNLRMPSFRAVLQILDTMTEGHLQRLTAAYELERMLLAMHECVYTINNLYMYIMGSDKTPTTDSVQFTNYLAIYLEIAMFSIEDIKARYENACSFAGIEPNTQLAEFGICEFADFAFAQGFNSFYNVKSHHVMGDTTALLAIVQKLGDLLSSSFASIIYTGDPIESNDH